MLREFVTRIHTAPTEYLYYSTIIQEYAAWKLQTPIKKKQQAKFRRLKSKGRALFDRQSKVGVQFRMIFLFVVSLGGSGGVPVIVLARASSQPVSSLSAVRESCFFLILFRAWKFFSHVRGQPRRADITHGPRSTLTLVGQRPVRMPPRCTAATA